MYFDRGETVTLKRADLYRKVWEKSTVQLAKELGISDVAIAKLCKKHHVPKPPPGYWARLEHGQSVQRPPLPKLDDKDLEVVRFQRGQSSEDQATKDPETASKIAAEKDAANQIVVADQLAEPHALIERTHKSLNSAAADERGIVRPKAKQCLDVAVSKANVDRAMRIMDALVKALEARGFPVSVADSEGSRATIVRVLDESLKIGLSEKVDRKERPPTPKQLEEKARLGFSWERTVYDYHPTGNLTLSILSGRCHNLRRNWTDLVRRRVESCLNPFIASLIKVAHQEKLDRIESERRERAWAEEQRLREEEARRIAEEKAKVENFDSVASAWRKSLELRAFVAALENAAVQKLGQIDPESNLGRWLTWAKCHADGVNPIEASLKSLTAMHGD
ncbi:MAG: hypothetical protein ABSH08_07295 [Tepidisphaeraceae bacterium]